MASLILVAASIVIAVNLLSTLVAGLRIRTGTKVVSEYGPVAIIRPIAGREEHDPETLESSFSRDDANVYFCIASRDDGGMQLAGEIVGRHRRAMLLIGDDAISDNPKLNNVAKGWRAASHASYVMMADSNVLLPPDAVDQMISRWAPDVGLVCSPPLGSRPESFAAELECAFLNTYQARWQFVADAFGHGFGMGKVMLWDRKLLDSWGGVEALASEVCEDAAATKVVRAAGLRVRLVSAPFPQLLGHRTFRQVLDRQMRWAILRRKTFPVPFAAELASTAVVPVLMIASFGWALPSLVAVAMASWYGSEMLLAWSKGWHCSWRMIPAMALRDILIPWIYCIAWTRKDFSWRGNKMRA
jgi:ceramide glucosyltransferase